MGTNITAEVKDGDAAETSTDIYKHNQHDYPHSQSHNHGILPSYTILIVVVAIASAFLLCLILLLILMLRRIKSAKDRCKQGTGMDIGIISQTAINITSSPDVKSGCIYGGAKMAPKKFRGVQVFTYKELEAATDNFSEANVIGNGGFGTVYKGVLSDGTAAAIKMMHSESKQGEREFRMEVDLLSRLHSPFLVELLGYCADQRHRLLILEYMHNGSLQQHLHSSTNEYQPLDWGTRLRIALDCAKALEFLHEHASPAVIHRDFKCTNILLDKHYRAKVSDFGLAKIGSNRVNGEISTRVLGTTGYLAPEYVLTGLLTTKSDVYSYGIVLLELLTGRVPIDTKRPTGEHVLVSWALPKLTDRERIMEMVDPALQGQYSKKDLIQIAAIAAVCVQPEADYRPLITDVVQSLVPLVRNLNASQKFQNQVGSPMSKATYNLY